MQCVDVVSSVFISLVMHIFLVAIKLRQVLLYYNDLSNKGIFWYLRVFLLFFFFLWGLKPVSWYDIAVLR